VYNHTTSTSNRSRHRYYPDMAAQTATSKLIRPTIADPSTAAKSHEQHIGAHANANGVRKIMKIEKQSTVGDSVRAASKNTCIDSHQHANGDTTRDIPIQQNAERAIPHEGGDTTYSKNGKNSFEQRSSPPDYYSEKQSRKISPRNYILVVDLLLHHEEKLTAAARPYDAQVNQHAWKPPATGAPYCCQPAD